jgi:hypothetical protein
LEEFSKFWFISIKQIHNSGISNFLQAFESGTQEIGAMWQGSIKAITICIIKHFKFDVITEDLQHITGDFLVLRCNVWRSFVQHSIDLSAVFAPRVRAVTIRKQLVKPRVPWTRIIQSALC